MRMRKKKHGTERINACSDFFVNDVTFLSNINENIFHNNNRIHLEIGCGKGEFVCEMAAKYPEVNFLAIERVPDVILLAAEKAKRKMIPNVKFFIGNVANLFESMQPHFAERIYINFPDPWPKKGYAKRRLTHEIFLNQYKKILTPNGMIFFKTDNRDLFDFSIEQFQLSEYVLENVTYDLHNSEYAENNIITEYEKNFSEKGFSINRLEAHLK